MLTIEDLLKRNRDAKIGKPVTQAKSSDDTASILEEKLKEIEKETIEKMTEQEAKKIGYDYINLKGFPISLDAIAIIPEFQSEDLKMVAFLYTGDQIRVGALKPDDPRVQEIFKALCEKYNSKGSVYMITEASLKLAQVLYAKVPKVKKMMGIVSISSADIEQYTGKFTDFEAANKLMNAADVSEIVTMIISSSLEMRSSDIHIEAEEEDIKIRYRIDGVLQTIASIEKNKWPRIISRMKLLSGLKMNVENKPQDGRFSIQLSGDKCDVRVSTLPTAYGESVVMRLLKSSAASLEFDQMGMMGRNLRVLKEEIDKPQGMILTTGPTGSGKTTTLYAVLNKLNDEETKIITLEDPVEYKLKGINQSQIDHSKGYNFADGLKSILRQDPDVVMVGELRDVETAEVAINAALTGHLVISTLHTNSAAGAIPRFLAMGVQPFLLAPSLNAVIGQRLCRRNCKFCSVEYTPSQQILEKVLMHLEAIPEISGDRLTPEQLKNIKFKKGQGCVECNKLGFRGRVGVHEVLSMNKEIESVILSGKVSEYEMEDIAVKNGMLKMIQDGLLKATQGVTTPEEIFEQVS